MAYSRTETAVLCVAGAVLFDMHDEWQPAERRYFSESSTAKLKSERDNTLGSLAELSTVS